MTTNVTILNNGPQDVKVSVIHGSDPSNIEYVIPPGRFHQGVYVYDGQELKIEELPEVKRELTGG